MSNLLNPLQDNVYCYLSFNEGSGTIAYDSSVNGNDGTNSSTTYNKNKDGSYSIVYSGASSSYTEMGSGFNFTGDYSISFWVKFISITTLNAYVIPFGKGKRYYPDNGFLFQYYNRTGGDPSMAYIQFVNGTGYSVGKVVGVTAEEGRNNTIGKWLHIIITKKSDLLRMYINTELVEETSGVPNMISNSNSLKLGQVGIDDSSLPANCELRELVFYDGIALTPEEVKKLYQDTYIGDNND